MLSTDTAALSFDLLTRLSLHWIPMQVAIIADELKNCIVIVVLMLSIGLQIILYDTK